MQKQGTITTFIYEYLRRGNFEFSYPGFIWMEYQRLGKKIQSKLKELLVFSGKKMNTKDALIIVDLQNDFCPGGALEVKDGDKIIEKINDISGKFFKVVATQDWHPENHISFAVTHNKNLYEKIKIGDIEQVLWPRHCVAGSFGAELHNKLKTDNVDIILRKGTNAEIDSYSAFFENDKKTATGLEGYFKNNEIKEIYVCGLATDYCVYFTALDAVKAGFKTNVLIDLSKGVDVPEGNLSKIILDMKKKGIKIIEIKDLK